MYSASNAFHRAVAENAPQMCMLIFSDAVLTNEDVNVTKGIVFNDFFNTEEDISIGQALSNEISFSVFNDNGYLTNYGFGDFTATIGVQTGEEPHVMHSTIYAKAAVNEYTAYNNRPYLKRNGTALAVQPDTQVKNILIYNGMVYCFLDDKSCKVYNDNDGSVVSVPVNTFMRQKFARYDYLGAFYNPATRKLHLYSGGTHRTYEFVPLGKFNAERPNVPTVNEIDFTCNDLMMRFEDDVPGNSEMGLTFPTTIGNLFGKICQYVGLPYRTTSFINSGATIRERPEEFEQATLRDVLKWIAEAACGNARIDRDGYVVIDWLKDSGVTITPGDYSTFEPYWYNTRKVTKLKNRDSGGNYDRTLGSGSETYLIQDNPLLDGAS